MMPSPDRGRTGSAARRVAVILAAGLLMAGAVSAEVYKWVDEQGRVHYGDARPADRAVETVRTPVRPSGEEVLRANSRLDALREREQAAQKTRAEEERNAQRDARETAQREASCREAKRQLHVLGLERPLYRFDDQGNRVYLDDGQRAAERAEAQRRVDEVCR